MAFRLQFVTLQSSSGVQQTLTTTAEHPAYVLGKGWIACGKLQPGDHIQEPDGGVSTVTNLRSERHPEGVPVYNFRVHNAHTYFVRADGSEAEPVWVHNTYKVDANAPAWKQYEQRNGGQQTSMRTTFQGEEVGVRLDKPPNSSQIIDFKDYDWSNSSYQKPFIQQMVIEDFQTQIAKYQTIRPDVHLQFSQEPPAWAVQAIKDAGGTYSVKS